MDLTDFESNQYPASLTEAVPHFDEVSDFRLVIVIWLYRLDVVDLLKEAHLQSDLGFVEIVTKDPICLSLLITSEVLLRSYIVTLIS